jgi:hypothetical protein
MVGIVSRNGHNNKDAMPICIDYEQCLNWHYSGIIVPILIHDYQNNKLKNMPFMEQSRSCLSKSSRFAANTEIQLISKRGISILPCPPLQILSSLQRIQPVQCKDFSETYLLIKHQWMMFAI